MRIVSAQLDKIGQFHIELMCLYFSTLMVASKKKPVLIVRLLVGGLKGAIHYLQIGKFGHQAFCRPLRSFHWGKSTNPMGIFP